MRLATRKSLHSVLIRALTSHDIGIASWIFMWNWYKVIILLETFI